MALVAKLVCNRLGWAKPSGIDCKAINPQAPLFEVNYGFGFEEWLFDPTHHAVVDDEVYYFGYLEGFRQPEHLIGNEIYLFTEMYNHQNEVCAIQTKRIIGRLSGVELINQHDFIQVQHQINEWQQIMRNQLEVAIEGHPNINNSLEEFDNHYNNNELFNIKFKIGYRYNLPIKHKTGIICISIMELCSIYQIIFKSQISPII